MIVPLMNYPSETEMFPTFTTMLKASEFTFPGSQISHPAFTHSINIWSCCYNLLAAILQPLAVALQMLYDSGIITGIQEALEV